MRRLFANRLVTATGMVIVFVSVFFACLRTGS